MTGPGDLGGLYGPGGQPDLAAIGEAILDCGSPMADDFVTGRRELTVANAASVAAEIRAFWTHLLAEPEFRGYRSQKAVTPDPPGPPTHACWFCGGWLVPQKPPRDVSMLADGPAAMWRAGFRYSCPGCGGVCTGSFRADGAEACDCQQGPDGEWLGHFHEPGSAS